MIYKGWIILNKGEETFLRKFGVCLLDKVDESGLTVEYRCQMDECVLIKLDEYWGQFFWGLQPDNMEMGM